MSDGVPPRVSSTAGSTWFSRHPRLRTAARTFAAAWCGSFVAAAAATLTNPAELVDDNIRVILFLVLAFFSLVVAIGIVRWNEFLPRYGLVIGSAVSLWLIPEEWRYWASLATAAPLMLWFVFGRRWRGSRWVVWLVVIMETAFWDLNPRYDVPLPESAYLPISLLPGRKRVRVFSVGEDIMSDWWSTTRYVQVAAEGPVDVAIAGGGTSAPLLSLFDVYGMMSRGDLYRRGVYRCLIGRLAPDGVLVMPRRELGLLPDGDWRFAPLPGASDDWLAARRGSVPVTDPEILDKRLQSYEPGNDPLLPAGAFAALYYVPQIKPVHFEIKPERRVPLGDWWPWLVGGTLLYFCARVWLCRREKTSTFVAALENALSLTLFTLGAVRIVGEAEFLTGIPPQLLFCGFGIFLLPLRPGRAGLPTVNVLGAAALFLPAAFSDRADVLWCCWLVAGLSGAAMRERLTAETPGSAAAGAIAGFAAGVCTYAALLACRADTFPAILTLCIVFRAGLLFRHWRG